MQESGKAKNTDIDNNDKKYHAFKMKMYKGTFIVSGIVWICECVSQWWASYA